MFENVKGALCGVLLGSLALTAATATQAEILRLAHHHAVGGTADLAANKFAELAHELSEGRLTVQVYPAAQLGQEREAYEMVNAGALDLSITSTNVLDKVYRPISVTGLPFVFRDWEHAMNAYEGAFGDTIVSEVRAAGNTQILGFFGLGFRDLLFRDAPVTRLADLAGMKMRSPEIHEFIKMYELLGARPTPVTWGEVYTAMQTGVAAGLDSPPATALDMKFEEVAHSLVRTGHMFGAMLFAMNARTFDSLTPADQQALLEAGRQAGAWLNTEVAIPAEEGAYARMEAAGMVVADPEDIQEWRAAVAPLFDEVMARNDGSAALLELLLSE
ncbi:TRAP transporter substrate-binding protein [Arenibacterium sp. LLYu02]|uniref:TRAP transporter substrate-binding protein n=1 Tax=Arenibacterium sp. LLYu02 TaxID=3404132 RepID=UPI003B21F477